MNLTKLACQMLYLIQTKTINAKLLKQKQKSRSTSALNKNKNLGNELSVLVTWFFSRCAAQRSQTVQFVKTQ